MSTSFFRGRRLRQSPQLREMIRETSPLQGSKMIMPYFVMDTRVRSFRKEIKSMPGQYQLSISELEKQLAPAVDKGLNAIMLFGIPQTKDANGTLAYADEGIIQQAISHVKNKYPQLIIVSDVCLCEYTAHGHCGLLSPDGEIQNDLTLELLAKTAISHARAGADIIAPSDMMDGRIQAIRKALDGADFTQIPIMSYAVKYASAYYGPFREAADSSPKSGDRKSYQMDFANAREALREAHADYMEGADILMVKPAGPYLDIIRLLYDNFDLPIAAYQVSGEYSQIKAASQLGWINEEAVVMESLMGIKRAGASIIINYFTEELLLKGII